MRLTNILFKQHLGRMFRDKWEGVRKRKIQNYITKSILNNKEIQILQAEDFLNESKPKPKIELNEKLKSTEGLYHSDNDLLVDGLSQAKILSNSVEMPNGLPKIIQDQIPNETTTELIHLLKNHLLNANIFNSTQEKLPRYKDPVRFFWKYPIQHGIPPIKKCDLFLTKMVNLCEITSSRHQDIKNQTTLIKDTKIITNFCYEPKRNIVLDYTVDLIYFTGRPLPPIATVEELQYAQEVNLPTNGSIHPHVSIPVEIPPNITEFFPVSNKCHHPHIHTAIFYFDKLKVKNLYDVDVNEHQIYGRSLMKTFALALSQVKQRYGVDIIEIPEPITIQSVHTDGQYFHFMIYQLNTLDVRNSTKRNIFWHSERIPIFSKCEYVNSVPTLEDFNPKVFNILSTLYNQDIQL